jgi:hypothetical protein
MPLLLELLPFVLVLQVQLAQVAVAVVVVVVVAAAALVAALEVPEDLEAPGVLAEVVAAADLDLEALEALEEAVAVVAADLEAAEAAEDLAAALEVAEAMADLAAEAVVTVVVTAEATAVEANPLVQPCPQARVLDWRLASWLEFSPLVGRLPLRCDPMRNA